MFASSVCRGQGIGCPPPLPPPGSPQQYRTPLAAWSPLMHPKARANVSTAPALEPALPCPAQRSALGAAAPHLQQGEDALVLQPALAVRRGQVHQAGLAHGVAQRQRPAAQRSAGGRSQPRNAYVHARAAYACVCLCACVRACVHGACNAAHVPMCPCARSQNLPWSCPHARHAPRRTQRGVGGWGGGGKGDAVTRCCAFPYLPTHTHQATQDTPHTRELAPLAEDILDERSGACMQPHGCAM